MSQTLPFIPTFRDLDRAEIDAVLARNYVGRVAFTRRNRIVIVPVHYVYDSDWIYGRTTPASEVGQAGERWWPVAFEVDEVDGLFDWRSVVVHGGLYTIQPSGPAWERDVWATAVDHLRRLLPETLRDTDPVPFRTRLFRIAVQDVTGKAASSGAATAIPPLKPSEDL